MRFYFNKRYYQFQDIARELKEKINGFIVFTFRFNQKLMFLIKFFPFNTNKELHKR
jgi:hypothetical protein